MAILRFGDPFDAASAVLLAVLLLLVGATFKQYAVTNDVDLQHRYGELIIAYYKSGAERVSFENEADQRLQFTSDCRFLHRTDSHEL